MAVRDSVMCVPIDTERIIVGHIFPSFKKQKFSGWSFHQGTLDSPGIISCRYSLHQFDITGIAGTAFSCDIAISCGLIKVVFR